MAFSVPAALVLPLFLAYAFAGLAAACAAVWRPLPRFFADGRCTPPGPRWYNSPWRIAAIGCLVILALCAALDNLRAFAGGFGSMPDESSHGFNYAISMFCYFIHKVAGALCIFPSTYLWACAVSHPRSSCPPAVVIVQDDACPTRRDGIFVLSCVLVVLGVLVGIGFFTGDSEPLVPMCDYNLGVWIWASRDTLSAHGECYGWAAIYCQTSGWCTLMLLIVGALLCCRLQLYWFFILQLVAISCQSVDLFSQAMLLLSNLCELLIIWALLALGWQLTPLMNSAQMIEAADMVESRSES